MFIKRYLLSFLIFLSCIAAYLVASHYRFKQLKESEIRFSSSKAGEVMLVWGINGWKPPVPDLLPANSFFKGKQVYTKMEFQNNGFKAKLNLPTGSVLNYCFLISKDKRQNALNEWDCNEGENYQLYVEYPFFRPGYFILLAGLIPLILLYFRKDNLNELEINEPGKTEFSSSAYIPQLDSLRALAVILVMIHHWLPKDYFLNALPNGSLGVNMFFVLSGFLITRILLEQKKNVGGGGASKLRAIGNFVARRSLRIFPIYYLLLFILFLLSYHEIREHAIYYFTYTANYLFYSKQNYLGYLSHVWSLAVEEQFYLFWPWLILFSPKKLLPYLIAFFIIIGISSNYIFTDHGWWVMILTPACFDAFGLGALLSYILVYRNEWYGTYKSVLGTGVILALIFFVFDLFYPSYIPKRTIHAVMALWLISYCLFENNIPVLSYILNNRFLIWMGKISYGIYLYHIFVPFIRRALESKFSLWNIDFFYNKTIPLVIRNEWIFMQEFVFVLLLASLSWVIIEKPMNSLKRKFG